MPDVSAIYFAISGEDEILYIGKALHLQKRRLSHHRLMQFESFDNVRIAWLQIAHERNQEIERLELACINYFRTVLNWTLVSDETRYHGFAKGMQERNLDIPDLSYLNTSQWQAAMQRAENPAWEDYI